MKSQDLLPVIALIAILAALLFPVFARINNIYPEEYEIAGKIFLSAILAVVVILILIGLKNHFFPKFKAGDRVVIIEKQVYQTFEIPANTEGTIDCINYGIPVVLFDGFNQRLLVFNFKESLEKIKTPKTKPS